MGMGQPAFATPDAETQPGRADGCPAGTLVAAPETVQGHPGDGGAWESSCSQPASCRILHWISAYWGIGNNKLAETFGGSPTVWGLGALISHNQITATLIIGGLAGLLILFGFLRVLVRSHATLRPVSVLALAVCVTLLVTPYTWTYDQLLLILPLTTAILAMDRRGVRFLLTASVFLGIDVLAVILLIFDTMLQVEILNVLVPLAVFGLCLWYLSRRIPSDTLEVVSKNQLTTTDERG